MTSLTLTLTDELVERIAVAAKAKGVSLEKMVARLVEVGLDDEYALDDDEETGGAETDAADVEVSPELGAELERRVAAVRAGTATLVPADEVFAELRARFPAR